VILDKSNDRSGEKSRYSGAKFVAHAGIPVFIDHQPAIAHNKIVIIDRHLVITGSYNFTRSAERRNAENVTFIDSAEVASRFLSNWNARRAVSRLTLITGKGLKQVPLIMTDRPIRACRST
jgi:phosphatidylserine/phosphatidylglycerophosphate/cardiolipin synthase-like enzyme